MNEERPWTIERTMRWAYYAHLTMFLNGFTLILGTAAALLIYLTTRKRAPFAAYHALQALLMQLVLWFGGGLLTVLVLIIANSALQASSWGLCLGPLAFLIGLVPLMAFVYAGIGAWDVHSGRDFEYYRAGKWARQIMQKTDPER